MLECNRYVRKRLSALVRSVLLLLPAACVMLLLSQVAFAKNTYVINDGALTLVHTTHTTDPEEVLNEAGLELGEDDTYTTQPGIGVSEINIQRAYSVTIDRCGEVLTVSTFGETAADLLARLDITLGENESMSVSPDEMTCEGMTIVISHTVAREESYTISVPYETDYYYVESLEKDVVLVPGADGQAWFTDSVTYRNGEEVNRRNVKRLTVTESVRSIVLTGTKELANGKCLSDLDSVEALNISLSDIAGSGMPYIGDGVIITPNGEVLTYSGTLQAKATAYTHTDPGCDMITATGTTVRVGTVAVDPRLIPYGTRMYIVTNDGKYIYGIAVAEDCGGAIKNARIDLYFETSAECYAFGVRQATIYFLDEMQ